MAKEASANRLKVSPEHSYSYPGYALRSLRCSLCASWRCSPPRSGYLCYLRAKDICISQGLFPKTVFLVHALYAEKGEASRLELDQIRMSPGLHVDFGLGSDHSNPHSKPVCHPYCCPRPWTALSPEACFSISAAGVGRCCIHRFGPHKTIPFALSKSRATERAAVSNNVNRAIIEL